MNAYVFRNWQQVADWIDDNGLVKYSFKCSRDVDGQRSNNFIFCYDSDKSQDENRRLLEKRLEAHSGQHLYGTGYRTDKANVGGMCCEVEYQSQPSYIQQVQQMVGAPVAPSVDPAELERTITERIETKFLRQRLEEEQKNLKEERRAFDEEKNSAVGLIVQYLAPVAAQLAGINRMANVAGAGAPVSAEKITPVPSVSPEPETEEDDPDFPVEEQQQVYDLIKRFRKVEPNYIALLSSVVAMAENGDSTYNMAKNFLIK